MLNSKLFPLLTVWMLAAMHGGSLIAAPVVQTVFYDMPEGLMPDPIPAPTAELLNVPGYPDDPARMTLIARLYLPDPAVHGPGPYPTVLFLHGAGGLWANNNTLPNAANLTVANSPSQQFRNWGDQLVALGYACLFPDSFHPRGITGNFEGKRPHYNPALDDAACSPNYERPKDVVAALAYLAGRSDIAHDRVALIGFSHGAQTGMNALVDVSVDLGVYQVDYIDLVEDGMGGFEEQTVDKVVPSPVRLPAAQPVPVFCAFFYGGGSHFGYHGQASSVVAGRYMLDRRTTAILFHGSDDLLMGITDHASSPISGAVFPIKQVLASGAQAATLGLANPIVRHYLMDRTAVHQPADARVGHSFDLGSVGFAAEQDWDTAAENPNQKARRLARQEVLNWLEFKLRPPPVLSPAILNDQEVEVGWPTSERLSYRLWFSETLAVNDWSVAVNTTQGTGAPLYHAAQIPLSKRAFFRLAYEPVPMPVEAPENEGFFLQYADFGF